MVASVVGGSPSDYNEICEVLKDFSIDEIIEAVMANAESLKESVTSVSTATSVEVKESPKH